jgi:FAD:protein FMN transferase
VVTDQTHRPTGARFVRAAPAMGTMVSVHVYDDLADLRVGVAVDAVFAEIERLEQIFSTFRIDSPISRVNRCELHLLDAAPEITEVLDACTWLEHRSGGAFNAHPPARPGQLDPAGFAKGWITERAAGLLDDAGLAHWYVGAGGDVVTRGAPAPGQHWRVGIADPHRPGATVATLELAGGAVATSGTAERGLHLWDGRTGRAASALASATVVGPQLAWADAFATTVVALGRDGLAWLAAFEGYEALIVTDDGVIEHTTGFNTG